MPENDSSEVWRPVVGYDDWYSISNWGRFRRDAPGRNAKVGEVRKGFINSRGYAMALLYATGRSRKFQSIHRLVAAAFIGPCPDGAQVNHKNGIKTDNRVENLEWVTPRDNTQHAIYVLRRKMVGCCGASHYNSTISETQVMEIRRRYAIGNISQSELGRELGLTYGIIHAIVRRKSWKHL